MKRRNNHDEHVDLNNLFHRLTAKIMQRLDMQTATNLSQRHFIEMLILGAESFSGRKITRVDLAELTKSTERQIYSYCAKPDSSDYREINHDKKISMLFYATSAFRVGSRMFRPSNKRVYAIMDSISRAGGVVSFSRDELLSLCEMAAIKNKNVS